MDYEAIRGGLQQAVPFNAHVGLEITEVGAGIGVVRLPDRSELRNHVGSQHAGALFAAGEAASGAAFVGAFADRLGEITPLVQVANIAYRSRAQGTITATGRMSEDAEELVGQLDEDGSVRFCVDVQLTNAHGDTVADMTVNWHIRKTENG
jgi:acyl-coenzyme A thioesterase PaaI-like protein